MLADEIDMIENRLIRLARRRSGDTSLRSEPPITIISSIGVGIDVSSRGGPRSLSLSLFLPMLLSWVAVAAAAMRVALLSLEDVLLCLFLLLLREDLLVVVVLLDLVPEDVAVETTEPRDDPPPVLPNLRDS